jgi:VCBS repeat-containing protein
MARLQSNTTIYGTANVQGTLFVGSVTPSTSNSNTTGSLVVTGGIGLTGPIYSTGGSITINNGLATTGNTGILYLGDGTLNKTFGSPWNFGGTVQAASIYGTASIQGPIGSNTAPSYGFLSRDGGIYLPSTNTIGISSNSSLSFAVTSPYNAINYLQASGNTTNSAPVLSAQGTDTNISIQLTAKGNGSVIITSNTSSYSNSNNALVVTGSVGVANSIYVANRVGFANTTGASAVYQVYNPATLSIDTYFG